MDRRHHSKGSGEDTDGFGKELGADMSRKLAGLHAGTREKVGAVFSSLNITLAVALEDFLLAVLVVDASRYDARYRRSHAGLPCSFSAACHSRLGRHFLAVARPSRTDFCLSCHTMEEYASSLYVDAESLLLWHISRQLNSA